MLKVNFGNLRTFEMKKIITCQLRFKSRKMRLEIANWKNSKISEIYNFSKFSNVLFNLTSCAFNPISREVFLTPIFTARNEVGARLCFYTCV